MKIGIDSNDNEVYKLLSNILKKTEQCIVDCHVEEEPILGEALKKKNIICYNARIDVYIEINIKCNITHDIVITTDFKKDGIEEAENLCEKLSSCGYKDIMITDGSQLYMVKNTKCKSILIDIREKDNINRDEIINCIINALRSSSTF